MRVLVADDDGPLRRVLCGWLRRWGHENVEAADGGEAAEVLLGDPPPDVAILDWEMPVQNGIEVCRTLRSHREQPYTYVILLTGRGASDDRIEGLDAGADDYLVKPFDPRELEVRLKTAARILGLQSRPSSIPVELVFRPPAVELGAASDADDTGLDETLLIFPAPRVAPATLEPCEDDPFLGRELAGGKYSLLSLIGKGATGFVYKAHHAALDRTIAVKILNPMFGSDAGYVHRFHREAVSTSMLDHPNVMRVMDFGREPDGTMYLAMELLEGKSLDTVLSEEEGTLPAGRVADIMAQVCAGLAAAHDQGIVHRDIKPENIVVLTTRDESGAPADLVKVCDFGIAQIAAQNSEAERLTAAGAVWGTPRYMSPEQAQGGAVDARSDLYSCGVVLYQMVTGDVPFRAKSPLGVLAKHVLDPPPRPAALEPDIDPDLEDLILALLRKDPAVRPQSAREVRSMLIALLARWSAKCTPPRREPRARPSAEPALTLSL